MKQKQRLVDQFLQTKEKDKGKKMGPHQNQDLVDYKSSDDDPSFHKNLLRVQKDDVFKKYEVIEQFGLGSMGEVSKVRIRHHKVGGSAFDAKPKGLVGKFKKRIKIGSKGASSTSHSVESGKDYYYALKTIQLDRIKPTFIEELKNEINILRTLDHPNIVKAHEVFLWKKQQIFIVLELCDGGDLYTRSPYSEKEAAFVTSKLLSALVYMHDHKVIHRDLKFENIMFESPSPHAEIKVIDFGLSKKFLGKPGLMTERVGTIYTMAPQVLQGVYSSQADLWSVGVIAYMLLSASKPFYARRRRRMIDLIMRGYVTYDAAVWEYISDDAKAFCNALLVVDPKKRLNAKQACKHPWIVNREKLPDEKPSEALLSSIDDCVLHYKQTSTLKKLALNVIAHKSTTSEIMQLRAVFDQYDTERNGVLSFEEFRSALEKMNYSDEELKEIFSSIDFNQNGKIMYTEFLAACLEVHGGIEEDRLAEAFDRIDSDDTGYISKENLREALGENCDTAQIDEIIAVADKNKDGTISYAEFLDCFREQTFVMANRAAEMPVSVSDVSEGNDLVGLDAKIPGGRFDSNLESSLRAQIESRYD